MAPTSRSRVQAIGRGSFGVFSSPPGCTRRTALSVCLHLCFSGLFRRHEPARRLPTTGGTQTHTEIHRYAQIIVYTVWPESRTNCTLTDCLRAAWVARRHDAVVNVSPINA